jgi:superfamily I DNA/RNA helicase
VAKPKFSFVLTEQQEHAKRLMIEGEHLLLSAYAGASKTTTLVVCAWEVADETGKYLGFNKSTAKDASGKFPPKCQCLTTHSLAFHAVAKKYLNAGKVLPGDDKYRRLWARDIAGILGIRDGYRGQTAKLPRDGMASLAKETVTRFCYSADDHVGTQHVPKINGSEKWDATEKAEVIALVTHYAGLYWSDVMDLYGKLNYDHDHYLKQYQLTKPVLKLDYLMLDEGQDTNPAVFDIFSRQGEHAQLIMVGDNYQSIYQWRGAVDAMAMFDAPSKALLSKSFRFGPAVADEANKWLTLLGAPEPLIGFEQMDSKVGPLTDATAILCRSNAQVIAETLHEQEADKKVHVQGGTREIESFAKAARTLMGGEQVTHPELIGFENWNEVMEYVQIDKSAKDLRTFVKIIEEYGVEKVLAIASTAVSKPQYADVVTSTAHKSKGQEYLKVRIASDFGPPEPNEETGQVTLNHSEMRLTYVAVTRAQEALDAEALAWVEDWLPTKTEVRA